MGGGSTSVIAAMAANAGIAVAKFVGFAMTGAASMLAEGIHSLADTGNEALLLWGGKASQRNPDSRRPFGYGRERYFWAFVVALVMFSMGGLYAMLEGVEKIQDPHEIEDPAWAFGILGLGMLLEGASFAIAYKHANQERGNASWWEFIRHTRVPELPTVLLEDFGALIGLALAMAGIGLAVATGDSRFDAMGSISVGILLIVIAGILAVEMKSLLIGEAADEETRTALRKAIEAERSVTRLIDMRTQHLGPDSLLVGVQAEFAAGMTFPQVAEAIDRMESAIKEAAPEAKFIYIEPANRPDDYSHDQQQRSAD